jgi:NADP-dependent 3-hydroxy acid dehydrogenase YdfG
MYTLSDRVVVVTGASSGIGRATCHELAKIGARVALIARNEMALESTKKEVLELGGEAEAYSVDVSDASALEEVAGKIENDLGPIDVWINNAMVSVMSPLDKMTPEEFRRVTEVTYLGYVWGTQTALKRMKTRNSGVILQVGSVLSHVSYPLQSAYAGAKYAIKGFSEALQSELEQSDSKVQVCVVDLPTVNTPQFNWIKNKLGRKTRPLGPILQPESAAQVILKEVTRFKKFHLKKKFDRDEVTETPEDSAKPDNLFTPVDTDYGVHGPFDSEARERVPKLALTIVKATGIISGIAAATFLGWRYRKSTKA